MNSSQQRSSNQMQSQGQGAAAKYIDAGVRHVNGWLFKQDARLIIAAAEAQSSRGISGAVGEIGVYHGKLFILLQMLRSTNERSFACDLFGDASFSGQHRSSEVRSRFESNLARFNVADTCTFACSSRDLSADQVLDAVGRVRLLSIDGDHSSAGAEGDLRLAEAIMCPGGIVAVDDVFNRKWPGVVSGLVGYLTGGGRLVPIVIGRNKVLLAETTLARQLSDAIATRFDSLTSGELFEHQVLVLPAAPDRIDAYLLARGITRTGLYRRARHLPPVERIRQLVRRQLMGR